MTINLLVIALIVLLAYLWSATQGALHALLHLLVVIAAASLAFATWEPLALGLGMSILGSSTWGVCLLSPFVLWLLVLGLIAGRLVQGKVELPPIANQIGGAVGGALMGVLIAGVVVIGIGFLPLAKDVGGIERLTIQGGRVIRGDSQLWLPVDSYAAAFFSRLSKGVFRSSRPLVTHQPDLADQAALFRLTAADGAAYIVPRDAAIVSDHVEAVLPMTSLSPQIVAALGPDAARHDYKLISIDTRWPGSVNGEKSAALDGDGELRLTSAQVRLIVLDQQGRTALYEPLAISQPAPESDQRLFIDLSYAGKVITPAQRDAQLAWVFVTPRDAEAKFLLLRHTRFALPERPTRLQESEMVLRLGNLPPEPEQPDEAEQAVEGDLGPAVMVTDELPAPINRLTATRLGYTNNRVLSGEELVRADAGIPASARTDRIATDDDVVMVRARISWDSAKSWLGGVRQSALMFNAVVLMPEQGEPYMPIGYVWLLANGDQQISFDRIRMIQTAQELPLTKLAENDQLYVYFQVPPGQHIVSLDLGARTLEEVDLQVGER